MLETYLVSFGVAVMPIWVAEEKYSKIFRQLLSFLAEPRWHSSTITRSKKSLLNSWARRSTVSSPSSVSDTNFLYAIKNCIRFSIDDLISSRVAFLSNTSGALASVQSSFFGKIIYCFLSVSLNVSENRCMFISVFVWRNSISIIFPFDDSSSCAFLIV